MKIQTNSKYQKEDRTYYFTTVDRALEIPDLQSVIGPYFFQTFRISQPLHHCFWSTRQSLRLAGQPLDTQ